jgi:hypothetical protein
MYSQRRLIECEIDNNAQQAPEASDNVTPAPTRAALQRALQLLGALRDRARVDVRALSARAATVHVDADGAGLDSESDGDDADDDRAFVECCRARLSDAKFFSESY